MTNAENASPQLRLAILLVVVACLFSALFARLWFLQVINAPQAQAVAADNGVRTVYIPAPRGKILDVTGQVLVDNVNEPVIEVNRQTAVENPPMVSRLAALLGRTVDQVQKAINNTQYSPYAPVPVAVNATPEQILYVQEHQSQFPGVQATSESVRYYNPQALPAANILGYVNQITGTELPQLKSQGYQPGDQIGQAGVEAEYESYLRGKPGVEKVQVDSRGNVLGTLSYTPPVPGDNIRLTINAQVQAVAVAALQQGEAAARATFDKVTNRNFTAPAGSAVVEDPNTGRILALATDPTYDPRQFVGGISQANYNALKNDPRDPQLDRTIQGQYAPGSTFKLVTALAGLKYGVITPNTVFDDTGSLKVGTFVAHNDNGEAYGPVSLPTALTVSSDNFFNKIGLDLWYGWTNQHLYGEDALQGVAGQLGFARPTGIDLPNEGSGKIPTPQSYVKDHQLDPNTYQQSQWYPGNSDQVAIGQDEDLVTPLQLANAYSTFANGGTLYAPILVKDAETPSGQVVKTFAAKVNGTVPIQPAWAAALTQGFEGVVNNPKGTAYPDFDNPENQPMDIAGKTGTAQVNAPRQDTSVFTSFAPATKPQFVVDSFMEDAGYGASVAAPVVREIYDALFGTPLQPVTYSGGGAGGQN
jgi:penicillin-binding protein 2